jgi:glutamate carboxypeptidase
MDTVYPASHPFQKAQMIAPDTLQGPGVADMKGGLVIMLKALEALEQHPACGSLGWEVLVTSDEEIGSIGSEPLFLEAAKRAAFGLIFEPSFSDGAIVSSRKGSANYTITSTGKAAHSGRDFEKGKNAIVPLAQFIVAAHQLNNVEKGLTVNIGRANGGGPVNVVPDFAACGINVRATKAEAFAQILQDLQILVDHINSTGASLELHSQHVRSPKAFDQKNQHLFALIEQCALEEGYQLNSRPSGGVCDGNILSEAGLGVIDTLGAIGGNIHSPEEYIFVDSLRTRARLTALLLFNIASGRLTFKGQL